MTQPDDEFVLETRAYQTGVGRWARAGFECRVIIGSIAGWWDDEAGWNAFYRNWRERRSSTSAA